MRTLLVLSKQPSLAAAIGSVLDPGKFQLIVKESVNEAEFLLARGAIDAAVLDADLTDSRAIRLIEELKGFAPGCPILVYASAKQWEWEEDAYLLGVVPGEMPKEWPSAALQSQAVAARSYTLASLVKNRPFDLYSDQRSQVYSGVGAESPATTAAVKATRGEILTYDGKVATTFYYSSSGGRTASSEDVFGVVTPYLQSRADPWDTLSPYHRWLPRSFTPASLAQAFGLASPVVDVSVVPTVSGRPASVTLVPKSGVPVSLKAADVRARLGLRSTAFRIGVLRVARPPVAAAPGAPVTLIGLARNVEKPILEKLVADGNWVPSIKVVPDVDGAFVATVRPKATATYRLTADGQVGPALTVTVAGAVE